MTDVYWCKDHTGFIIEHFSTPFEGHRGHIRCVQIERTTSMGICSMCRQWAYLHASNGTCLGCGDSEVSGGSDA